MTITYGVGNKLYLNITNVCPCRCVFCIRNNGDSAYDSDPLWLDHAPSFEEIKAAIDEKDLSRYKEVVFCGFGEPTCRIDALMETADYLRTKEDCPPIRLNTNGLTKLFYKGKVDAPKCLAGKIDTVSVSLNAGDADEYARVTVPAFGAEESFAAVTEFILEAKKYIPTVKATLVDAMSDEEIEKAKKYAEKLGVPLRIREWEH